MTQPEALRLADACDLGYPLEEDARQAAAELRRLAVVEAQRDALLEALRRIAGRCDAEPMYKIARAAIKAVEEKT